jgi:hypothetical protein
MPAQRFQLESIAYESIEPFEAFAHVRGSQGQINLGGRPDSKHGLHPLQDGQQPL